MLRVLSMVVGAGVGVALYMPLWGDGAWTWGSAIGSGGGALATVIVAVVRSRIKKLAE